MFGGLREVAATSVQWVLDLSMCGCLGAYMAGACTTFRRAGRALYFRARGPLGTSITRRRDVVYGVETPEKDDRCCSLRIVSHLGLFIAPDWTGFRDATYRYIHGLIEGSVWIRRGAESLFRRGASQVSKLLLGRECAVGY